MLLKTVSPQTVSPGEKRKRFKEKLKTGQLLQFPGAYAPIISLLIQKMGFDGVYLSGAVLANDLGYPDIGLTTLSEIAHRGKQIARVTELPSLIDADTGFGNALNTARTIQELEEAGLCACHIEDQIATKRCGHLDNKTLISVSEMSQKIRAASDAKSDQNFMVMARCDAKTVEGLDKAIDRAKAYVDAGADMIFPEALYDEKEFEIFRKEISVPLLANMTEFGKSKLLTKQELQNLGYNIVIYPVTSQRLALYAVENGLQHILENGSQEGVVNQMQTRQVLYELLQYEAYNKFDQEIYNFSLHNKGGQS